MDRLEHVVVATCSKRLLANLLGAVGADTNQKGALHSGEPAQIASQAKAVHARHGEIKQNYGGVPEDGDPSCHFGGIRRDRSEAGAPKEQDCGIYHVAVVVYDKDGKIAVWHSKHVHCALRLLK